MDRTRAEVLEVIGPYLAKLGWRVRADDGPYLITLLPPLARSNVRRNRWPDEPEEGPEVEHHGA